MDVGRMNEIPRAFKEYGPEDFELKIIEPSPGEELRVGPIPRPTFQVLDKTGRMVAYFHPYGNYGLHDHNFKPIYIKMIRAIEEAAQRALEEFERMDREK